MANIKQLMEGHQRLQKESTYVKGNLNPTSVKNAVGRTDVGGGATEMSQFLGALLEAGPQALDAHNRSENEKNEKLKKQGYLEYKSAKPSSLKAFRENSPLSENPYYKWGVDTADAESVLQEKGNDFEKAYGEWKFNRPKVGHPAEEGPQSYQQFVDGWIEENQPDIGTDVRNPIIMGESFWPGMDAIIGAKGKDHAQYEAKNYQETTARKLEQSYNNSIKDPDAEKELISSPDSMETIIANEESIEKELSLLDRLASGSSNLDANDALMGKTTPLQKDMIGEIFGKGMSTKKEGGKTSETEFASNEITVEPTTCENIVSDYAFQMEGGDNYEKPPQDITTEGFKKASHYPDLVASDSDAGKVKRVEKKLKKTEVSASSGKGKRMQNKVADHPQDEVKDPVYERQTWGAVSYLDEGKTTAFYPKVAEVWSNIVGEVQSDTSLPKEAFGEFVMEKWRGTGRLQIQLKMPPQHILDQYPEAKKLNEDLLKKSMEKLDITNAPSNEGMI